MRFNCVDDGACVLWICLFVDVNVEFFFFFFQAEDGIRDRTVTGVQTCALPIYGIRVRFSRMERFMCRCWMIRRARLKRRSEERRVGKECRSRWSAYH